MPDGRRTAENAEFAVQETAGERADRDRRLPAADALTRRPETEGGALPAADLLAQRLETEGGAPPAADALTQWLEGGALFFLRRAA